jgi:hypothetical protein
MQTQHKKTHRVYGGVLTGSGARLKGHIQGAPLLCQWRMCTTTHGFVVALVGTFTSSATSWTFQRYPRPIWTPNYPRPRSRPSSPPPTSFSTPLLASPSIHPFRIPFDTTLPLIDHTNLPIFSVDILGRQAGRHARARSAPGCARQFHGARRGRTHNFRTSLSRRAIRT